MGDGRYFTWLQFTKIVYYTFLCMVLVFDIVYLNTKSRKRRTLKYLLLIKAAILIVTVLRFYETLIYRIDVARVFRELQVYSALIVFSLIVQVFFEIKSKYLVMWVSSLTACIGLIWMVTGDLWLLKAYPDFDLAYYHPFYIAMIGFLAGIIMVGGIRQLVSKEGVTKYDNHQRRFISLALMVPVAFYFFYIIGWTPKEVQVFFGLLIISSLIILWVLVRYTPGELLPLTYIQLIEDIRETVVLFDSDGQIIYNNNTVFSRELNLESLTCTNCYEKLFDDFEVVNREAKGTDLKIELVKEEEHYFLRCKRKEIIKSEKVLGYLLVIEDLSHLEKMLNRVIHSTEELNAINESLQKHAAVVATIEAERERNRLMLEVQNYLGHRFAELAKVIENIIGSTEFEEDEQVVAEIQKTIDLAKENLGDIRKTVVDYRSSYDKSYVGR